MIIYDETIEEYHLHPALSKTCIQDFDAFGPVDFHARHVAKTFPGKETDALAFGRAFDYLCEHGEEAFPKRYARKPEGMKFNTKEGKAWGEIQVCAGLGIIDWDDWTLLLEMYAALRANRLAFDLWEPCRRQVTIRRELPALGVELQARPDGLHIDSAPGYLADIKTCRDINRFPLDCITYGYHVQLAIAQWLLAREGHQCDAVLIAVESKRAPRCRAYRMPEVALAAGWEKAKRVVDEIARRTRESDWTDRQDTVEDIVLPEWQARKLEAVS